MIKPKRQSDLNPVFIVGSPRSGTTVVLRALESLDQFFVPHIEGHMLYWLLNGIARVRENPDVYRQATLPTSICHGDNFDKLLFWVARMIDGFERDIAGGRQGGRWIDKTPDLAQLKVLPLLQEIFPYSQAIFLFRHPRDIVLSTRAVWNPKASDADLLKRWAKLHKEYREVIRPKLNDEMIIEIRQEDMAIDPTTVAAELGHYLNLGEIDQGKMGSFLSTQDINRAPEKRHLEFGYKKQASPRFRRLVQKICGNEMRRWGYSISE